jgi:hypothetical protein
MDQPLDLSVSNNEMIKKKLFTIEYLTSDIPHQIRSPLIIKNELFIPYLYPPLHPVENQLNRFDINSRLNEHVVPNICSPPLNGSLEMVNGGHGIKNPLFDCATEALQIKYGKFL